MNATRGRVVATDVTWAPVPNTITMSLASKEIAGECGVGSAGPCTSVFAVVVDPSRRVLLVRVAKRGWDLPGGHIEAGESVRDALARELAEETGLDLADLEASGARVDLVGELRLEVTAPKPDGYPYPYPRSTMRFYRVELTGPARAATRVPDEVADVEFVDARVALARCADRVWVALLAAALDV